MLSIKRNGIEITRGDSVRFRIRFTSRELAEGTRAVFTVKATPWEPARPEIEKQVDIVDNAANILLEPWETDIMPGFYVWDIRLHEPAEDGRVDVITPMEYAAFRVMEAIGE